MVPTLRGKKRGNGFKSTLDAATSYGLLVKEGRVRLHESF